MDQQVLQAIAIPFLGTVLGAGCVFVMGEALPEAVRRALTGFAAGVMVSVVCFGLLTEAAAPGTMLPVAVGVLAG